ncbi:proenkephalin-A [Antechinus flavipes]|uniref:proenkephalin-A n=1 Tax=Antechinus flavipes TaxID=38775 RepID=UPI0022366687|nr:proenkephalin-A [Antechinus flavipes]
MALFLKLCSLLLALSPGLFLTIRAECSKDCTSCTFRLGQHADINPLACTLECEGKLPSAKAWDTCKELLQLTKTDLSQESTNNQGESKQDESHLLSKKYGGFMKRYGGFMKKMDEIYRVEPEDEMNGGEVLAKRYGGFMKKDSDDDALANSSDLLLKELLGTGDISEAGHYREGNENEEEMSKRYGGFMRSYKRSPELEDEAKELQKRYGGFMRRVGRPEWWLDYQKRYGGFLKRFADSLPSDEEGESYSKEIPEMEKRYGGFMRF